MGIFYWHDYSVYFFDEDTDTDYVGDFMEDLMRVDKFKALEILSLFFERLEEGRGIPESWFKGKNPKVKDLKGKADALFEYRDFSDEVNLPIRIYFAPDKYDKMLVFLDAHFKRDDSDQNRRVKVAYKRWRAYLRSRGIY